MGDTSWRESLLIRPTGTKAENMVPLVSGGGNWAEIYANKALVHKYGLLHESVHIVIISGDGKNILLQQRGKNKKQWKEYWDIIGEHVVKEDRGLLKVAKNVFREELGKKWRSPIYEFDVTDELNYTNEGVTKCDYEKRHVYVIIADDIDNHVIETMNNELEKKGEQETLRFKWFNKNEFDECLLNGNLVPYAYWKNSQAYDNFKAFFREKARTLGHEH